MDFIESCDFLGKEFKFNIKGRYNYKNVLGGLISLFILAGCFVFLYYFGKELVDRKIPRVLIKQDL